MNDLNKQPGMTEEPPHKRRRYATIGAIGLVAVTTTALWPEAVLGTLLDVASVGFPG